MTVRRGTKKGEESKGFLETLLKMVPADVAPDRAAFEKKREELLQEHRELLGSRGRVRTWKKWSLLRRALAIGLASAIVSATLVATCFLLAQMKTPLLVVHQGMVSVYRNGAKTTVGPGAKLRLAEQDRIVTSGVARASIQHAKSRSRLDCSTEVVITGLGTGNSSLVQRNGRTYHRVQEGNLHEVSHNDVTIRGNGCAFETSSSQGQHRTIVLEGRVELAVGGGRENGLLVVVEEGEEALAGIVEGKPHVDVHAFEPRLLEGPWYRWNLERDESENLASGNSPVLLARVPSGSVSPELLLMALQGPPR